MSREMPGAPPRAGLLVAAALCVLSAATFAPLMPSVPALVAIMVVGALLAVAAFWQRMRIGQAPFATRPAWVTALAAMPGGFLIASHMGGASSLVVMALEAAVYSTAAAVVADIPTAAWLRSVNPTRIFVAANGVVLAYLVLASDPRIDVWVFLTEGARALVHGENPYAITYTNIFNHHDALAFYGPGVVAHGRVIYGFPYPPVSLLSATLGYLLGDVRLSAVIAVSGMAWLLADRSADRRAKAIAVLLVVAPGTVRVVTGAWTEPVALTLLGVAVWGMTRRRFVAAAILIALFVVSKQYFIVALPCLWLLRPQFTRRQVAIALSVTAAACMPFFVVNPTAFLRAIVKFQFVQPFRPDSLSLTAWTVSHFGWPSPAVYNLLPLVVGLVVAIVFSVMARPGSAQFAAGVGLSLLATIVLSKQAFLNYYYLVGGAFLVAAWAATPKVHPDEAIYQSDLDGAAVPVRAPSGS